jgi:hypothetical protein
MLLIVSAFLASAVPAPFENQITVAQAEAMAMAPIEAAPQIAERATCKELWDQYIQCKISGLPDCKAPVCD